jgi:hypothetical protein
MGHYAIRHLAGRKYPHAHLTPSGPRHSSGFYSLWYEWLTDSSDDTWATWIRPLLDAMPLYGLKGVAIILHSYILIDGGLPLVSTAQFEAKVDQLCNYAASKGLIVMPSLMEAIQVPGLAVMDITNYLTYTASVFAQYNNVPAMVAMDEIDVSSGGNANDTAFYRRRSWVDAARSGLGSRSASTMSIGCTLGAYVPWSVSRGWKICNTAGANAAGSDFGDAGAEYCGFNLFNADVALADLEAVVFNANGTASRIDDYAVMLTSIGAALAQGSSARVSCITSVKNRLAHAALQAAGIWDLVDYDGSVGIPIDDANKFGLLADHQTGGVFDQPRTNVTDITLTMPTEPGGYSSAQDDHATISLAPAIARAKTLLGFSWLSALGPGGTVTYTPQAIPLDRYGFPDFIHGDWIAGTPTTTLSGAVSGLSTAVPHACRVRAVSNDGGETFSPWTIVNTLPTVGATFRGAVR